MIKNHTTATEAETTLTETTTAAVADHMITLS